ncbi:MaoC family dehydratase [Bradyrhizobium sp. 1]|uniref:MaoC family dehydratase n=1 Tax=Bradyrhizobium sp. 1 TaxID=241591 RepID=UPI001FF97DCC|nr:MaoC family dehydratase [Bradyrhizobium sp. 1]
MRAFSSADEVAGAVGEKLGPSDWVEVTQAMVDAFAAATGDRQWIHVDTERAAREAPGGKTIAHGYLLLSLLGTLMPMIFQVEAMRILNYGLDKLRFLAAVPVGSRIRLRQTIKAAEKGASGWRVTNAISIEIEGAEKPAMIADVIFVYS